ncbi:cytochrome D ubiquinol oxidase subunit II, partial [Pseudomonas sp. MAFF212428]|nr:cytochrome D ubiquinol oxidase subunit II [Pseudomonas brassicae]
MPYQPSELLANHFKTNAIDLSHIEQQLKLVAPDSPNLPLYRDMMLTVLRMAHDDSDRWSAKITLQALRELDNAFRALRQYKGRRKVT